MGSVPLTFAVGWAGLGKPTGFGGAPLLTAALVMAFVPFVVCVLFPARRGRLDDSPSNYVCSCNTVKHLQTMFSFSYSGGLT
jgi:hypothetical protein